MCFEKITDSNVEVDHILAKVLGGKDTYSNLQLLHKHCHVRKTHQDLRKIKERRAG
jgi:RNA-directed DNA polymerase